MADIEKIDLPEEELLTLPTLADELEKRANEYKRIQKIALSITNSNDWVKFGKALYLTSTGAEKIRTLLGINISDVKWERKNLEDGHYIYVYTALFSIGDTKFWAIGSASSKSKFFSKLHGVNIPPQEVNEVNIMKSAYSNLLVNGITRLLGIRGITAEELKQFNIHPTEVMFEVKKPMFNKEIRNEQSSKVS